MALKISISSAEQTGANFTPLGVDLPDAYVKITALVWNHQTDFQVVADESIIDQALPAKSTGMIIIHAALWPNADARKESAAPLGSQAYVMYQPDFDKDILAQAYDVVKNAGFICGVSLEKAVNC